VSQAISGAYSLAAAQSLFANRLLQNLHLDAPTIDPAVAIGTGASEIQHVFLGEDLAAVTHAYMVGIQGVFAFALACSVLAVLLAMLVPFTKLPDHSKSEEHSNTTSAGN
jgi:hypothetical protein